MLLYAIPIHLTLHDDLPENSPCDRAYIKLRPASFWPSGVLDSGHKREYGNTSYTSHYDPDGRSSAGALKS